MTTPFPDYTSRAPSSPPAPVHPLTHAQAEFALLLGRILAEQWAGERGAGGRRQNPPAQIGGRVS